MTPIKRKVEIALAAYLESLVLPELVGVPIAHGHRADKKKLPCVIVYAEKANENDEFPPGTGVFDVTVKVFVLTQADDENVTAQDNRVAAVQASLFDNDAVCMALNALASPPDNRMVKDVHFYKIIETQEDEGRDDRHFGDVISYQVVCQGVDG